MLPRRDRPKFAPAFSQPAKSSTPGSSKLQSVPKPQPAHPAAPYSPTPKCPLNKSVPFASSQRTPNASSNAPCSNKASAHAPTIVFSKWPAQSQTSKDHPPSPFRTLPRRSNTALSTAATGPKHRYLSTKIPFSVALLAKCPKKGIDLHNSTRYCSRGRY
jgi:hypothetical protein